MRKGFLICVILAVVLGMGVTAYLLLLPGPQYGTLVPTNDLATYDGKAWADYKQANQAMEVAARPIPLSQPIRLAVGGLGLADEQQNNQLGDLVTADLTGAPGLELVERQSLDSILKELNLTMYGFVRAKDGVRVGKLLKVDWFLFGTETKLNGTNSIVIRMVDAHTGILRDAGVIGGTGFAPERAAGIVQFVKQSRENAAQARSRVYLAIGGFEDLSLNNRQVDFSSQLQGYLTTAYQGGEATLLERASVDTLLREVDLDLAGLTEGSETNPPQTLLSALWLVSGQYQSYETSNEEVEVHLDIQRIFGKASHVTLRGLPGEAFEQKIKAAINQVMAAYKGNTRPTRESEAIAELEMGIATANLNSPSHELDLIVGPSSWSLGSERAVRQKYNIQTAIRAFETVLLLQPDNRKAKMCLAACWRDSTTYDIGEARRYYRELIDSPTEDAWSMMAKEAVLETFNESWGSASGPEEAVDWFDAAALAATNPAAIAFFQEKAETFRNQVILKNDVSKARLTAEGRMLQNISNTWILESGGDETAEMDDFVKTFGTNQAAAAQRLKEIYPKLKAQSPQLAPYLLAQFVPVQVDTNASIVREFQETISRYVKEPNQVYKPNKFWWHTWPAFEWCFDHKLFETCAQLLEAKLAVVTLYPKQTSGISNDDKLALAYAYLGTREFSKALDIFESYAGHPIETDNEGPWGCAFSVVLPSTEAAYCRKKLGIPAVKNPAEFNMGDQVLCLCTPSTFTADGNGLWVGIGGQLLRMGFDLKTNQVISLPMETSTPITSICLSPMSIWVGTDGEGLIEYDKASGKCRHYLEENGLMMNTISSLYLSKKLLWIGYGHRTYIYNGIGSAHGGGLGQMDAASRRFKSYTLSLADGPEVHRNPSGNIVPESTDKPTRRPVLEIGEGAANEIWFVAEDDPTRLRMFNFKENAWTNGTQVLWNASCLANGADALYVGQFWNSRCDTKSGPIGVSVYSVKDRRWQGLGAMEGLPSGEVTTLRGSDDQLWVGGLGYIAQVDPVQGKILHFAYVKAASVNHIEIAGGYVWAQFDWHLYRKALSEL